jgi:beta-N-acetylhexosaminidase
MFKNGECSGGYTVTNILMAASRFLPALPLRDRLDEVWPIIEGYAALGVAGLMVGVGGRLPLVSTDNGRGAVDPERLARLIEGIHSILGECIIAVDGEGGGIFNILEGISPLKSPRSYTRAVEGGIQAYEADLELHSALLAELGVTMNFAPLLDVAMPDYAGYCATDERSYSDDPHLVAEFASVFIQAHRKRGIICTAKHFPGYGHLSINPHTKLSDEGHKWNESRDLLPYRMLAEQGILDAVMKGHATIPQENRGQHETGRQGIIPATFDPAVDRMLRALPGFRGISVADELYMGAVNDYYRTIGSGRDDGDPKGYQRAIDAWRYNELLIISYPIQNTDGTIRGIAGGEERTPRMVEAVARALDSGELTV